MEIVRCAACDGYGWIADEGFEADDGAALDATIDCTWCAGVGYVMRGDDSIDRAIPAGELARWSAQLEALERERMREIGYTGEAKHPNEQAIRKNHFSAEDAEENG
ncbi:MAG: hypothetical protein SGI73_19665 [Chloroflexota bacterium]|nr:hypothetical protein [Chloroflexota bacterium]